MFACHQRFGLSESKQTLRQFDLLSTEENDWGKRWPSNEGNLHPQFALTIMSAHLQPKSVNLDPISQINLGLQQNLPASLKSQAPLKTLFLESSLKTDKAQGHHRASNPSVCSNKPCPPCQKRFEGCHPQGFHTSPVPVRGFAANACQSELPSAHRGFSQNDAPHQGPFSQVLSSSP